MKNKIIFGLGLAFVASLSMISCQRNKTIIDESLITEELGESQARAEYIDQDATDVAEQSAAKAGVFGGNGCQPNFPIGLGTCATVTVTGNFPAKNILVDFGTGCTNAKGITRSGSINIVLTDSIQNPSATATMTFNNYFVNGFKREGIITRTNTTVVGSNTRSWNRTVVNGKVTTPAGLIRTHNSNLDITQTAGLSTPCDVIDDVFSIAGTRTVTNNAGKTRTSTTQTPLQKKGNCSNIDQGILLIQGGNKSATLDFGSGNCDNQAILTVAGKSPKTITLK